MAAVVILLGSQFAARIRAAPALVQVMQCVVGGLAFAMLKVWHM